MENTNRLLNSKPAAKMPSIANDISFQENEVVEELKRRTIHDITPGMVEDSTVFYRFAKARDFDLKEAESMIRKHISWRKEYDIDNLKSYKASEVVEVYSPTNFIGYDKTGRPIRYVEVGNCDMKGFLSSAKTIDIIKFNLRCAEEDVRRCLMQSAKLGRNISTIVYIYDFENLTFAKATYKKSVELLKLAATMYQDNYPERIHVIYMLNVSIYFQILFATAKAVLAAALLNKIKVFRAGSDEWKDELREIVDLDVLPAFLGGNRTDPDGNPMCNSFIIHGEDIPRRYFRKKSIKALSKSPEAKKVTVTRFSKTKIVFEVTEAGSFLEWEFETKCRDIGFGLYYRDFDWNENRLVEVVPKLRIDTYMEPEVGVFKCEKAGTYVMEFDNSYSWIYGKEIYYKTRVLKPDSVNYERNNSLCE